MSKSPSRRFPVTVTRLPVTGCEICHRTAAYRPGRLSEVLTQHNPRAHPELPAAPSQEPSAACRIAPRVPSPAIAPGGDLARAGREKRQRSRSVATPRKTRT